ncbi:MAG: hypothetical protein GY765_21320, partial [bacterium]|nr:hypothetical protein [bacterium]
MPGSHFLTFLKKIEKGKEKFPVNLFYGYNEFLGEKLIDAFCKIFIEKKND